MTKIDQLKAKIEDATDIVIMGHINPDGDAIGAGLALTLALEKKYPNKKIDFVLQDSVPNNIKFLEKVYKIKSKDMLKENYSLAIFVDSATLDRVGEIGKIAEKIYKINIDHHVSNSKYGDLNIVNGDISSTSELLYGIIKELEIELDKDMAEALYLGLVNDTGNFSHSNVTENTLKVASELVKAGANNNKIVNEFFKTKSYQRIKILGKALSEMKFDKEKKLVYFYLPYSFLEEIKGTKDDTEGIVEEMLNFSESEVSLFLREDESGKIKGSMRSKRDKDVNKIANVFGGGGHIKAAGFTTDICADKIIETVLENL